MADRALEQRLATLGRTLDAGAPAFDPASLRAPQRRRVRRTVAAAAVAAALAGALAAPSAVPALGRLLGIEWVEELGPVAPDVAPPHLGPPVPLEEARARVPFRIATIAVLGPPDALHVRDDVGGGMITVAHGPVRLTQWSAADVGTRVAVVPARGTAEQLEVGPRRAVWIAGEARGTLTVVGADGALHKEAFVVADGALLWDERGVAFLLQGAGSQAEALRLAAGVG